MGFFLFILYALLLSFALSRCRFITRSGISLKLLVSLFLFYTAAGCAHVLIAYHYFPNHGDVWDIFNVSVSFKEQLLHNYPAFKKEMFPDAFSIGISGTHIGWSYYQQQLLATLQMLFNFISFDNIYINILLFNFLMLFGRIAFYRLLRERYPTVEKNSFILSFCIPSIVFWTSVVHKEGLLFFCLGFFVYLFSRAIGSGFRFSTLLLQLALLFIIFITRKAVFLVLLPAITIWYMNERAKWKLGYAVPLTLGAFALLLIIASLIYPSWSLLYQLSWWQHEFMQLSGNSRLFVPAIPCPVWG